ncbi:hypothetical protein [Nocardia barduliensis]|uniref:hypothetical protein n=1 Tax=Nocardia barduliensis TaxID=2736643 RepID=UPI001FE810E8|nr:hypothetical protein [Nocardia barduliensis]
MQPSRGNEQVTVIDQIGDELGMTHDARNMREPCRKFTQQFVRGPPCPLQELSTHVATVVARQADIQAVRVHLALPTRRLCT